MNPDKKNGLMNMLIRKYGLYNVSLTLRLTTITIFTIIGAYNLFIGNILHGIIIILLTMTIMLYLWEWIHNYKKLESYETIKKL